jgi:broad specificity phosphatase PhoE
VRHAEKTKDKKDPTLTEEGTKRAQDLALRLKSVPLTKIYSSDYKRTRDTAAPIAAAMNLEVIFYNPRDLEGFSKDLLMETRHILVVGHSNTTPELSAFLGGESGEPIVEATEYDRLYILQRRGEKVITTIERYGGKS